MQAEPDYLALYSTNCLKCSYLIEGAKKKFKCHYSKGNEQCPASELRITITGKSEQFLKRLRKARAERNAQTEAEIWSEIANETPAFQARMYDLVNGKL